MKIGDAIGVLRCGFWRQYFNRSLMEEHAPESLESFESALDMAISALRDRETVELLTRDGLECVENVRVSKQLATHLRPYRGCPRGPMGLPWDASPIKLLRDAKDFLMRGQDETFVCVPRLWYEPCVEALEKMQEAARIETPTLFDLMETEETGHGQAGAVTSP